MSSTTPMTIDATSDITYAFTLIDSAIPRKNTVVVFAGVFNGVPLSTTTTRGGTDTPVGNSVVYTVFVAITSGVHH